LDAGVVLNYNHLDSDAPLATGQFLQIPANEAPAGALNPHLFVDASNNVPEVISHGPSDNTFPYGQCTYWVASQPYAGVTWRGDAGTWLEAAKAVGRSTGMTPVAHSIVVFSGGGYDPVGHVASVESVQ